MARYYPQYNIFNWDNDVLISETTATIGGVEIRTAFNSTAFYNGDFSGPVGFNHVRFVGLVPASESSNFEFGFSSDDVGTTYLSYNSVEIPDGVYIDPSYLITSGGVIPPDENPIFSDLLEPFSGSVNYSIGAPKILNGAISADATAEARVSLNFGDISILQNPSSFMKNAYEALSSYAADAIGVPSIWDSVKRVESVSNGITQFHSDAFDLLQYGVNNFENIDAYTFNQLADSTLRDGYGNLVQTFEEVAGINQQPLFQYVTGVNFQVDVGPLTAELDIEIGTKVDFTPDMYGLPDPTYLAPEENQEDKISFLSESIEYFSGSSGRDVVLSMNTGSGGTFTYSYDVEVYLDGGDDVFAGGAAAESVYMGSGDDDIETGAGDDSVNAGGSEAISFDGNDIVNLGDGNDMTIAGGGFDILRGGGGTDLILFLDATNLYVNLGQNIATGDYNYLGISNTTRFDHYVSEFETVIGGDGADTIIGGYVSETFFGGSDNDYINGDAGFDTSVYNKESEKFTIQLNKFFPTAVIDRTGAEGIDTVINIEELYFGGSKSVYLESIAGVANISSSDLSTFIEMYIAYFNRAPDAEGLYYWGTRLSEGMSIQDIAKSFFVQDETVALYGGKSNAELVDAVYQNFLGRAPDAEGKAYWVTELDNGKVQAGEFLLAINDGAKAATGSTVDQAYIEAKADLGAYFSVINGMSNVDNAKAAMALFDGSDASKMTAKNAIDDYYYTASQADGGELLIQLVGVMDDPFAAV